MKTAFRFVLPAFGDRSGRLPCMASLSQFEELGVNVSTGPEDRDGATERWGAP
jgi:hypothetical protein